MKMATPPIDGAPGGQPQAGADPFFGQMVKRRLGDRRRPPIGRPGSPMPQGGIDGAPRPGPGGMPRPMAPPIRPPVPGGLPPAGGGPPDPMEMQPGPPVFQAPGGMPGAGGGVPGLPPPPVFQAPGPGPTKPPAPTASSDDVNLGPNFQDERARRLAAAQRQSGIPSLRGY